MKPALASAVSFVMWTPASYVVHRDFSFLYAGRQFTAMAKFTVAFLVRLAAAAYTVHLATSVFASPYLVGVFANWIVLPLVGYLVMDLWVFRTTKSRARPRP